MFASNISGAVFDIEAIVAKARAINPAWLDENAAMIFHGREVFRLHCFTVTGVGDDTQPPNDYNSRLSRPRANGPVP